MIELLKVLLRNIDIWFQVQKQLWKKKDQKIINLSLVEGCLNETKIWKMMMKDFQSERLLQIIFMKVWEQTANKGYI